jgi:hypothetical protein
MNVPKGQTKIAQRFNAGLASPNFIESRRDDRKCSWKSRIFFRPFGAFSLSFALPTVETVGYFLPPLRGSKQRDAHADTSALEREIDELVYALCGLTPEEIKLVEGAAR